MPTGTHQPSIHPQCIRTGKRLEVPSWISPNKRAYPVVVFAETYDVVSFICMHRPAYLPR